MRNSYDYFTGVDGRPGDALVGTGWVDPTVRMGRLVAMLTGLNWTPSLVGLSRVAPFPNPSDPDWHLAPSISALHDRVRDALAAVPDDRVGEVGQWWTELDADESARRSTEESTAVLKALVGLCRSAVATDQHLYVASGF